MIASQIGFLEIGATRDTRAGGIEYVLLEVGHRSFLAASQTDLPV
jgi:hypothetical protein